MAKFIVSYQEAVEKKTVGITLHNWLKIQFKEGLFPEDVDRLVIGWIAGAHDLIFDTEELV